jgi:sugar phosphate isomerase/epimerase
MRYAFCSFSLTDASLAELLAAARQHGYDGVEPRLDSRHGHGIELATDKAERASIRSQVADSGIEIVGLATSVRVANPETTEATLALGRQCIELAADLGVPRIRVFGGLIPDSVSRDSAQAAAVKSLTELARVGADHDVTVCLETHDDWTVPQRLADIMSAVNHPNAAILWDVWHTGRGGGASLADAHKKLKPWIRHVHFHDGELRLDRLEFQQMGRGQLDHLEVLALLRAGGNDVFLSGEWLNWEPGHVHLPRERQAMARYEALLDGVEQAAAGA